ncbi:hypothetical protein NLI96_g839 [Meripilus lineatus]|uniref:Uncharacterized protein n=1 Tax=Meripilus lineatus TaxID=2056292 RepID=A0AAD5VD26_9APHY|nr:hypothetical protein NLI96_g839 [Physisporinus lineatus]
MAPIAQDFHLNATLELTPHPRCVAKNQRVLFSSGANLDVVHLPDPYLDRGSQGEATGSMYGSLYDVQRPASWATISGDNGDLRPALTNLHWDPPVVGNVKPSERGERIRVSVSKGG